MRFSEAMEQCISGKRIRNTNWNGKNIYVYYVKPHKVPAGKWMPGDLSDEEKEKGYVEVMGHFDMLTANGKRTIGWLASQVDMQSEGWEVL